MNPAPDDWQALFLTGIGRAAQHWLIFFRDRPLMDAETWARCSGHALRALTWCANSGRYSELATDLALALFGNEMRLGHWHEWEITLRRVIAQVGETADAERLWDLNAILSYLLFRLHQLEESISLSKQNYQIAVARQDVFRQQDTLIHLAETYLNAEAFDQALRCAEETRIFLGHAARIRGDWAEALVRFREALPMVAGYSDPVGVGTILSNIGWALTHLEQWAEGAAALEEAIGLLREHGNRPAEAVARQRLADLRQRAASTE